MKLSKVKITNKGLYWGLIVTFLIIYICVGFVSTLHAITFFQLANTTGLAVLLALAFEIGQSSVLFSILMAKKENQKVLPWVLMVLLTGLQITGNVFASFRHIVTSGNLDWQYFQKSILFGVQASNAEMYQVIISWAQGALLPVVALGLTALVAQNINLLVPREEDLYEKDKENLDQTNDFGPVDLTDEVSDKIKDIDESGIGGESTKEQDQQITDYINKKQLDESVESDYLDEEVSDLISEEYTSIVENTKVEETPKEEVIETIIPESIIPVSKKPKRPPKLKEKAVVPKKEKGLLQKEEKVSVPQKELQTKLEAPQNKEVNKLFENIKEAEVKDSIINSKIIDEKSHDVILTPNDDKLYIDEYGVNVIDGKAVEKDDSKIKKN